MHYSYAPGSSPGNSLALQPDARDQARSRRRAHAAGAAALRVLAHGLRPHTSGLSEVSAAIFHVDQRRLLTEPLDTVRSIYDYFGLTLSPHVEHRMSGWI